MEITDMLVTNRLVEFAAVLLCGIGVWTLIRACMSAKNTVHDGLIPGMLVLIGTLLSFIVSETVWIFYIASESLPWRIFFGLIRGFSALSLTIACIVLGRGVLRLTKRTKM